MKNHINYTNYINPLFETLKKLDKTNLKSVSSIIAKTIKKNNSIFICGNGGSAAISNHYICDFLKLIRSRTKEKPKIYSLSNSIELITAISNDMNYDKIFSYQLESVCKKNDLVILISASGNSKNIINALKFCNKNKVKSVGFSGFNGGYLKKNCKYNIHVALKNYGQVEDAHHILMHFLMEDLIKKLR